MTPIRALDLFCGAGGSSWGARNAGATIVAGVDASSDAAAAYKRNFPSSKIICQKLESLTTKSLKRRVGYINLLLASPECTNHSPAKGSAPRCEQSKRTALQVVRFAESLRPRWVVIENVVNMRSWSRYDEMLASLHALDYHVVPHVLNAADYGVPQSRRRLFVVCQQGNAPPSLQAKNVHRKTARSIIQFDAPFAWRPLRVLGRAADTLERARRAMRVIGTQEPFLIVYYGSDGAGGWQRLDNPLRTITTLDRFAIVKPTLDGHIMRMLQVPELKAAMGMPRAFVPGIGTRRDQIRAIGNAVCPPVMEMVIRRLLAAT